MRGRIFIAAILFVFMTCAVFADEQVSVQANMAGGTFKALAKAYLSAADFDGLKKNSIAKLKRMADRRYARKFVQYYAVLHDLPEPLRKKYGISPDMKKAQAIAMIASLDRKQAFVILDAVPNAAIAREVKRRFAGDNYQEQGEGFTQKVRMAWEELMGDISRKPWSKSRIKDANH